MCTKSEVREVMREAATPQIVKYIMWLSGVSIFALLSWLTFTVHKQDANVITRLNELKEFYSESLNKMNVGNARLVGKIEMLTTELKNIREVTLTQTRYRSIVVDERCKVMSDRMERMEKTIEKHHSIK